MCAVAVTISHPAQLFSNAFAALPAELGPDGRSRAQHTRKFAAFGVSNNRAALLRHKQASAQRKQVCTDKHTYTIFMFNY